MRFLLFLSIVAFTAWGFFRWRQHRAKAELLSAPLTDTQRQVLAARVPLYEKTPAELRSKVDGKINLFLDQIEFIGCDGLVVTEEMRLLIAAQACLLIANNNAWYKDLRTILVYPGAFQSRQAESDGYVVTERKVTRVGESWMRGPVVLSWAHAEHGAFVDDDGHNVVIHEFAHQLDALSGETDGAPVLGDGADGAQAPTQWAAVFREAYGRLTEDVEAGRETFLDPYGATKPAEFFAVVVEFFFEKPEELKAREPALYIELVAYFGFEPSA